MCLGSRLDGCFGPRLGGLGRGLGLSGLGDSRGDGLGGLDGRLGGRRSAGLWGLGGGRRAVHRDAGDHLPDRDRLALLDEDLADCSTRGRGQLDVDLVGRDLDDGVVHLDGLADLHTPFEDRSLGDRLSRGRGYDVYRLHCRGTSCHRCLTLARRVVPHAGALRG